jgi:aminomethyltransferase
LGHGGTPIVLTGAHRRPAGRARSSKIAAMNYTPYMQHFPESRAGLPAFEPGTERCRVSGGGALLVALSRAIASRSSIAKAASCESPLSRRRVRGPGRCSKGGPLALPPARRRARMRVHRRGAAPRGLPAGIDKAAHLFEGDSRPGDTVPLTAERDCVVIFYAPGGPMSADAQDAPTDLTVIVKRAAVPNVVAPPLPEPLADPSAEIRIDRCTAQGFLVKAGEYIQIIDVAGRQCSDFQAFNARQLDKGIERCLDMTATRSMVGFGYPGPGLYSKFFDHDLQPLVEVVRDTVGRHDSFGLACTARYYDALGYPGHVNCTDNFNAAVAPFGVEARGGWPAINFFYNTGINAQNAYFLDEPWSRPGDYVLLRATTDIVCASSACPDDIDAANAWNPTDIHVRVYPAEQPFSRAIAFRMAPDAEPRLTRETAFHPRTSALTRNFAEYRGFWLPTKFNNHGAVDEYWACREKAVVMDLSPLRKFEVLGPDAETLMQLACTRNVRKLAVGQVVYTALCYEHGGMLDDGTVFRLGPNNFRWVGGDEYDGKWLREIAEKRGLKVWVKSSTDQLHNIAVQGPNSREILKRVV